MQIKVHPLKKPLPISEAVAAPLEHFDFVIEPLDKPAGLAAQEIVGNDLKMGGECLDEAIETAQSTVGDAPDPAAQSALALSFRQRGLIDGGQRLTESMGLLKLGRSLKDTAANPTLIGTEVFIGFAQNPMHVLQRFILRFRQLAFEATHLFLA